MLLQHPDQEGGQGGVAALLAHPGRPALLPPVALLTLPLNLQLSCQNTTVKLTRLDYLIATRLDGHQQRHLHAGRLPQAGRGRAGCPAQGGGEVDRGGVCSVFLGVTALADCYSAGQAQLSRGQQLPRLHRQFNAVARCAAAPGAEGGHDRAGWRGRRGARPPAPPPARRPPAAGTAPSPAALRTSVPAHPWPGKENIMIRFSLAGFWCATSRSRVGNLGLD